MANMKAADAQINTVQHDLDKLQIAAAKASTTLESVKLDATQTAATRAYASEMQKAVDKICVAATGTVAEIERVKISEGQAVSFITKAEMMAAAVEDIKDEAQQANRALDGLEIRQAAQLRSVGAGSKQPGTFLPGRVFVGDRVTPESFVRGVTPTPEEISKHWAQTLNQVVDRAGTDWANSFRQRLGFSAAQSAAETERILSNLKATEGQRLAAAATQREKLFSEYLSNDVNRIENVVRQEPKVPSEIAARRFLISKGLNMDQVMKDIENEARGGGISGGHGITILGRRFGADQGPNLFGRGGFFGRGGLGGNLASLVPGGRRATGAAFATGVGLAAPPVAALLPAVGALATLPTILTGGIAALGTVAAAYDGISKSIAGNVAEYKQLDKSQQQFVRMVQGPITAVWEKFRKTAGGALFPGLDKAVREIFNPAALATFNQILANSGKVLGQIAVQIGAVFQNKDFLATFKTLAAAGMQFFKQMTTAAIFFGKALGDIAIAALPLLNWMGKMMVQGAQFLAQWTGSHAKAMSNFFDQTRVAITLLFQTLGSLIRLIFALMEVLQPLGVFLLNQLNPALNALAGWLLKNKVAISAVLMTAVSALIGALKDLLKVVKALIEWLTPLVKWIIALGRFAESATGGIISLKHAIEALITLKVLDWAAGFISGLGGISAFIGLGTGTGLLARVLRLGGALTALASPLLVLNALQGKELAPYTNPKTGEQISLNPQTGQFYKLSPRGLRAPISATSPDALAAAAYYQQHGILPGGVTTVPGSQAGVGAGARRGGAAGAEAAPVSPAMKAAMAQYNAILKMFNNLPAFKAATTGANAGPAGPTGLNLLPPALANQLLQAQQASAAAGTVQAGQFSPQQLQAAQNLLAEQKKALAYLDAQHATGKKLVELNKERLAITKEIAATEKAIGQAQTAQQSAAANARFARILGLGAAGQPAVPGAVGLRFQEQRILLQQLERLIGGAKPTLSSAASALGIAPGQLRSESIGQLMKQIAATGFKFSNATLNSLNKINTVLQLSLKEQIKLDPDIRQNLANRLKQINDTLKAQQARGIGTNFRPISVEALVNKIPGLSLEQKLALEGSISQAQAHRFMVPTGGAALGIPLKPGQGLGDFAKPGQYKLSMAQAYRMLNPLWEHQAKKLSPAAAYRMLNPYVVIHTVEINISGAGKNAVTLAREIRQELLKTSRRNATQTRGPNAGRSIGLN